MEGGLMSFLVKGAQGEFFRGSWFIIKANICKCMVWHNFPLSGRVIEDSEEKQAILLKNYLEHVHNKFNKYAFCFFFCELLNICISISQVKLMTTLINLKCMAFKDSLMSNILSLFSTRLSVFKASLFICKLLTWQSLRMENVRGLGDKNKKQTF